MDPSLNVSKAQRFHTLIAALERTANLTDQDNLTLTAPEGAPAVAVITRYNLEDPMVYREVPPGNDFEELT